MPSFHRPSHVFNVLINFVIATYLASVLYQLSVIGSYAQSVLAIDGAKMAWQLCLFACVFHKL